MTLKIAFACSLALAGLAVLWFFDYWHVPDTRRQNHFDANGKEGAQRKEGKEASDSRDAAILSCIAVSEAEYVAAIGREYNKIHDAFSSDGRLEIDAEIRRRIEHKKETSESNCRREYDQTASPLPSP